MFDTQPNENIATTEKEPLTVSQASLTLKKHVEENFRDMYIRGEISGYKRHTSGHHYFALKDQDAVLDAVAWRGTSISVQLEDGLEVFATGRITTYPGRSKYQIIVERVEPAGKGALMKLLQERKERLQAEGLFTNKKAIPLFPNRIGIITSPTGAVIKDILHRLEDRYPCAVTFFPVQVQGPGSVEQVARAIIEMNKLENDLRPDVIIVARGGGSLEDLWTFNEEAVVRAAATSTIPLISAIGHETDTTLIDYASDLRAPTPTAAAELATPVRSQLIFTLRSMQENMHQALLKNLRIEWLKVKGLARGIPRPEQTLETLMQKLDDRTERFTRAITNYQQQRINHLVLLQLQSPAALVDRLRMNFDFTQKSYSYHAKNYMCQQTDKFSQICARLEQASYTKILEKGFVWTDVDGQKIPSAAAFPETASQISLHFVDGTVSVCASKIEKQIN